jgi:DNA repair protein RecO (recombination protein O)
MQTKRTSAIILRRINYGEADRILTLLTKDFGKLALIAKGVRKEKSKLAGGIELFSESDISFIKGKGDIGTLVSTQLVRHFGNIHTDYDRMQLVSTFLKRLDTVTEVDVSPEYYELATDVMLGMNSPLVSPEVVAAWGTHRLLHLLGEVINTEYDSADNAFTEDATYRFSFESSRFVADANGLVEPSLIKFIRFLGVEQPATAMQIKGASALGKQAYELLDTAYKYSRPVAL